MSIKDCIDNSIPKNVPGIKEAVLKSAKKIEELADRIENIHNTDSRIPDGQKRAFAEQEAMKQFIEDVEHKQFQEVYNFEALQKRIKELDTDRQTVKKGNMNKALKDMLNTVDDDSQAIMRETLAELPDTIEGMKSKLPGGWDLYFKKNQAAIDDLVRAINGDKAATKEVQGFAKEIIAARDLQIKLGRSVGMKINELENYGINTSVAREDLLKMKKEPYIKNVLPMLDPDKMRDPVTGLKIPADELPAYLGKIWDEASKGGVGPARGALGGTMNADAGLHRTLKFKGTDGEVKYLRLFQDKIDLYDILRPMEYRARDIAIYRKFGSKYKQTFKQLKAKAEEFSGQDSSVDASVDSMWKELIGETEGLANENLSAFGAILRSIYSAKSLGMAGLNSIPDQANVKMVSNILGMSFKRIASRQLSWIFKGAWTEGDRQAAARAGLLTTSSYHQGRTATRYMGAVGNLNKTMSHLLDLTVRLSGANKITQLSKEAVEMDFEALNASHATTAYADLPQGMKNNLEFFQLSAEQWDRMRLAADTDEYGPFLNYKKMSLDDGIDYMAVRVKVARAAIAEPDLYTRAVSSGGQKAGTVGAELRRGTTQHLSFAISGTNEQLKFLLFHESLHGVMPKAKWVTHMAIYNAMAGMVTLSLGAIAIGKDLPDFTAPETWVKAMAMGNIAGTGFFGRSVSDMIEAPTPTTKLRALEALTPSYVQMFLGAGVDASNAVYYAASGDMDKAREKATKTITGNIPVDSPYRLVFRRLFVDQINKMADPSYINRMKKSQKRQEQITGQEQWWKTGDLLPSRLPGTTNKDN